LWIVGALVAGQEVWDGFGLEGLRAFRGADVFDVLDPADTFGAIGLGTWTFAAQRSGGQLVADTALVLL
jgi:hypothetical protein